MHLDESTHLNKLVRNCSSWWHTTAEKTDDLIPLIYTVWCCQCYTVSA